MSIGKLVQRELRSRWQRQLPLLIGGGVMYGGAIVLLALRVWRGAMGLEDAVIGARILAATAMFCCAVGAAFLPALATIASSADDLSITGQRARAVLGHGRFGATLATLFPAWSAVVVFVFVSAAPMLLLVVTGLVPPGRVAAGLVVVLLFGLAVVSMGTFVGWTVRDGHAAAGLIYLVVLLSSAGPVLAGPVISRSTDAERLITAVLVVNPFAAVAHAIDYDIARARVVYVWSPIGQRRFVYPGWQKSAALFAALAVVFTSASAWQLQRLETVAQP